MKTALFIIFAMTATVASPVLALVAQAKPQSGDLTLVIAPPFGMSIDGILAASGMTDIYPDRAPIGAFVQLEDTQSYDALIANGAWLVLRGEGILELC